MTSTKTAKLDFRLPYHEFKICSLEPSLPDPVTAPLSFMEYVYKDCLLLLLMMVDSGDCIYTVIIQDITAGLTLLLHENFLLGVSHNF